MSNSDRIRRDLTAASRMPDAPTEMVGRVLSLLNACYRGEIAEFKVVNTRRGVDVFETKKRRL